MNANMKLSALAALLLCTAMGSYAASVESEVSATDNVVIGAASEKVTLRVTGYKNLKGNETVFGSFYISTTSRLGQLVYTLAPENEPSSYYNGSYYYIKGKIKNEAGESSEIVISGSGTVKEINGGWWNIAPSADYSGQVSPFSGALKPGTYNIGLRAAIYQQ